MLVLGRPPMKIDWTPAWRRMNSEKRVQVEAQ